MTKLIIILLGIPFLISAQKHRTIDESYNEYLNNTFIPTFANFQKIKSTKYKVTSFERNPQVAITTSFGIGKTYEEALLMAQILWSSKFFGSYGYVTDDYQNPSTNANLMRELLQIKMNVLPTLVLKHFDVISNTYAFDVLGFKKVASPIKAVFYNYTTEGATGIGKNYRLKIYQSEKILSNINLNSKSLNNFKFNGTTYRSSKTGKQLVYFQHFNSIKSQANAAATNVKQVADYYNASGRDLKRLSQKGKIKEHWGIKNLGDIFKAFTI